MHVASYRSLDCNSSLAPIDRRVSCFSSSPLLRRPIGRTTRVLGPILLGRAHALVRLRFTRLHFTRLLSLVRLHCARLLHRARLLRHARLLHLTRLRFVRHARLDGHPRAGRGLGTCYPSRRRSDRWPHDLGARLLDHRWTGHFTARLFDHRRTRHRIARLLDHRRTRNRWPRRRHNRCMGFDSHACVWFVLLLRCHGDDAWTRDCGFRLNGPRLDRRCAHGVAVVGRRGRP